MGNYNTYISLNRTRENLLGVGSFGTVYKGYYGSREVAVKIINRHMLPERYQDIDKNEIVPFVKELKHPNIITIFSYEDKYPDLWLALELCDCSLDSYIKENELTYCRAANIVWQSANGLQYLHDLNVIHRDIKPDNFLIVKETPENKNIRVKVTDFSLSRDADGPSGSTMTTVRGNKDWMAPELLTEDGHGATDVRYKRSIDVFSFALVIIYTCVNSQGRKKFYNAHLGSVVKSGVNILDIFTDLWLHDSIRDAFLPLVSQMILLDPDSRLSMREVTLHLGPIIISTPPTFEHITSHVLGMDAPTSIAFGSECMLLGCYDPASYSLYKLEEDGYHQVWKKPCPSWVGYDFHKLITGVKSKQTIILRSSRGRDPTRHYDMNFQLLKEDHVGDGCYLFDALEHNHSVIYYEHIQDSKQRQFFIYNNDCEKVTLETGSSKDSSIRNFASSNPSEPLRWIAICDLDNASLHIFDKNGVSMYSERYSDFWGLSHSPFCTESYIFASRGIFLLDLDIYIYIHNWKGECIRAVGMKSFIELKLGDKIQHLHVSNDNIVQIALGPSRDACTSLHAFRVSNG